MNRLLAAFSLFAYAAGAAAQPSTALVVMPGTGISITPPPGVALARAGSVLIDSTGATIFTFSISEPRFAVDNDPTWRAVFPHPPELTKGRWPGKLYQRTRAADGGGWDGWMLSMPLEKKVLTVMAMYTGTSSEAFQQLKGYVLTTAWRESALDPEAAFGVRFTPRDLKLVQDTTGGLSYNRTGVVGDRGRNMLITPLPVTPAAAGKMFPDACQPVIAAGLGAGRNVGPKTVEKAEYSYCEGWNQDSQPEQRYVALVRLNTGALLSVMASSPGTEFADALPVFREAVATLRGLRGR